MSVTPQPVRGDVDERFGPLAEVFADNFTSRQEVGAALAVYVGGHKVVDLSGGVAEPGSARPFTAETPAVVFSCTKGVLAVCAYLLVEAGTLDLDAPVVRYWPEFGRHGKQDTTVRWLLAHRAGLPALDEPMRRADVLAWRPVIAAIEAQRPLWTPGTAHSYHAMTYGWLVGEVIRRITGLLPGAFFAQRVAGPLGLRTWIGLPASQRSTVAWTLAPPPDPDLALDPVAERGLTMGGAFAFPADADGVVSFNDPAIQAAGVPGAGGMSTADGLARLYAACVSDVDGQRLLGRASIDDAVTVRSAGRQVYGGADTGHRWGTGFMLDSRPARPMLGPRSFGHDGAGGLLAFGDDEHEVGFAYVVNQMGPSTDDRAIRLTAALRSCLGA
ncbi:serine hydrolase [Asanoa sp. WMMD1127]|uniref:serine hydrolase domain-containing protein n=1 Tax=Asanoa sp. WMMD1127 TaxID=3016107 RepID=UPI002416B491|nr:serine hydrolase domain-containing protein [Asanoa sp. WMMD1127]MDG4825140.1 serine hydrolase [Asanoa sp. WMMD1127]